MSPASQSNAPRPILLLVEDDGSVRRSLQFLLLDKGFDIRAFASAVAALASAVAETADVLVADYRLADGDGISMLRELRRRGWPGKAVLITGMGSPQIAREALDAGFLAVLNKPVRPHELLALIR